MVSPRGPRCFTVADKGGLNCTCVSGIWAHRKHADRGWMVRYWDKSPEPQSHVFRLALSFGLSNENPRNVFVGLSTSDPRDHTFRQILLCQHVLVPGDRFGNTQFVYQQREVGREVGYCTMHSGLLGHGGLSTQEVDHYKVLEKVRIQTQSSPVDDLPMFCKQAIWGVGLRKRELPRNPWTDVTILFSKSTRYARATSPPRVDLNTPRYISK